MIQILPDYFSNYLLNNCINDFLFYTHVENYYQTKQFISDYVIQSCFNKSIIRESVIHIFFFCIIMSFVIHEYRQLETSLNMYEFEMDIFAATQGVRYITEDLIKKITKQDRLEVIASLSLTLSKEGGKKIKVRLRYTLLHWYYIRKVIPKMVIEPSVRPYRCPYPKGQQPIYVGSLSFLSLLLNEIYV